MERRLKAFNKHPTLSARWPCDLANTTLSGTLICFLMLADASRYVNSTSLHIVRGQSLVSLNKKRASMSRLPQAVRSALLRNSNFWHLLAVCDSNSNPEWSGHLGFIDQNPEKKIEFAQSFLFCMSCGGKVVTWLIFTLMLSGYKCYTTMELALRDILHGTDCTRKKRKVRWINEQRMCGSFTTKRDKEKTPRPNAAQARNGCRNIDWYHNDWIWTMRNCFSSLNCSSRGPDQHLNAQYLKQKKTK